MDIQEHIWERKKIGLEMRQRYELYFATLIFTLLGLAIQTAKPPILTRWVLLETTSWACFLLAGSLSLWRLSKIWFREFRVGEYLEAQWEPNDKYKEIYTELNRLDVALRVTEWCRWILFLLAIVAVAAARASALF